MIIRILSEGQYQVDESELEGLNVLDSQVEDALDSGDQAELTAALNTLLDEVRSRGTLIDDDLIAESRLILPPADASIDEVRALFDESSDGLIPG